MTYFLSLLVPEKAMAVDLGIHINGQSNLTYQGYIREVFNFSVQLGLTLTTLMLIYAGYKYMISRGNPSDINEAKEIIIGSLSGFALLLLSYLLLRSLGIMTVTTGA